jgi:hypothetical protein
MDPKREKRLLLSFFVIFDFVLIALLIFIVTGKMRIEFKWNRKEQPPQYSAPESKPEEETSPAEVVDCSEISRSNLMVAITFGQSNAANSCGSLKESGPGVYSFYNNQCFKAKDPLPGSQGKSGSIWTRLGDSLVKQGYYDSVLFVPLAVGGTSITEWMPGSPLHVNLIKTIQQLRKAGFSVTHLFWVQGERDGLLQMDKDVYKNSFLQMLSSIRAEGVTAPIYVSLTSRRFNFVNLEIHKAQMELVDASMNILPGPNTDVLGKEFRDDGGIHFSDRGVNRIVEMYMACLDGNMGDCQPSLDW